MGKLNKLILTAETSLKLGLRNVLYVAYYRFSLKAGFRKKRFPLSQSLYNDFFIEVTKKKENVEPFLKSSLKRADEIMDGQFTYYHYHKFDLGLIPGWFTDPFSQNKLNEDVANKHWVNINEFDLNTGDIKNLWEISRFDWVTDLARGYAASNDKAYLVRLNELLHDWSEKNPLNCGVNWRCGQETSIRLMKLYNASIVLEQINNISHSLFEFILSHIERINANIRYAVAQDNNHGTSEAAGLYIGATWLLNQTIPLEKEVAKKLLKYKKRGRKILEKRIDKLILSDGTFAQKSVNYHRVVVDTMSFVLYAMKYHNEPNFNTNIEKKLNALGEWLLQMISNKKGEVSNLGANDGAMFENIHSCDYSDYRSSVQLFFALLNNELVWSDSSLNEPMFWRNINLAELKQKKHIDTKSEIKDKEFVQLTNEDTIVRITATQDNFRPGNEVMHIDVWHKGVNIIMDSGSYSYNDPTSDYYKSIAAHNSLQFGTCEPMPKLSRFLNGKWVKVKGESMIDNETEISWSGTYTDYRGNRHKRCVAIQKNENTIIITDQFVSKTTNEPITLRFNIPDSFENYASIICKDNKGLELRPEINQQYHSLYYMYRDTHNQLSYIQNVMAGEFQTIIKLK